MEMPTFSPDQEVAFSHVADAPKGDRSLITGEAGSGKSYLTKVLREFEPEGSVLCATTGQAAQIIGGRTIHSFIGLLPHRGLIDPRYVEERICACKRLFIDEISMLSDVNFDLVMNRFEDLNHFPQLVLIGDFLQLPPVNRDDDESVKHNFAFKSAYWKNIKVLKLTQQHRQSDPTFISALNDIRVGKTTQNVVDLILSRKVNKLPDDCTQLFSTRAAVHEINAKHVLGLSGVLDYYNGDFWQEPKSDRAIDKSRFRFPPGLHLKPRARIVMLNNDKAERWINGSTGMIHSLSKTEVKVVLDNGYEGPVERIKEEQYNGDGRVIATLTQFPLMLARAMTIHKAQGLSMDRVGVCMDNMFECAHMYVGPSRARTRDGLFLSGTAGRIKVSQEAMGFYRDN